MALTKGIKIKAALLLGLALVTLGAEGASFGTRRVLAEPGAATTPGAATVFDITNYGAKPDSRTESAMAMIRAWNAACKSSGPAKLVIPNGEFRAGEVVFQGPCTAKPLTVEVQGTLLAQTDLSLFTSGFWISIEHVEGVEILGSGTINGQGEASWKFACAGMDCSGVLPVSLVFQQAKNCTMRDMTVLNGKGFHTKVLESSDIKLENLTIVAPGDSPNTDGVHISRSQNVRVTNTVIGTGDDCISIGEGNTNVTITQVTCGPGHGISIGSLGKRPGETDVKGVTVRNCTINGTTNGARIKSYHKSPKLLATGIIFEDIIMENVKNPIIIDQNYGSGKTGGQSNVKISDVHFTNIRGTSVSKVAVSLSCSSSVPCEDVELADIDLTFSGLESKGSFSSLCANVKPVFSGVQNPAACP
ncbi:unnamed protein product [Ilex paraguariensis]|uniref:Uncharacterized protein n=1 Tax=Ilex paraguariensis TaxID=185542 RepID=A0ABC8QR79_9AQUA